MNFAWQLINGISFGVQHYESAGIIVTDDDGEELVEGPAIEITFLCFSLMVVFV